jgi:KDO2-lipid IV(A) lauroyltransferase
MKRFVGFTSKGLALLMSHLPIRMRLLIGDAIALLWFDILRIRRKVAIDNLQIAFPDKSLSERTRLARQSLQSLGRTIVEYSLIPFFREKRFENYFKFEGLEHFKKAVAEGKGVILLSMHVGNGDLAAAAMARLGCEVYLISKEFKTKWLNDMWFGMRRKNGTHFISPEKSSFEILRALKRGKVVVFVLDQFMGPPAGVRTKFFGRETGTAAGCALIAGRTGAPVLPSYTWRNADGTHSAAFEAPIPFLDEGPRDQNITVMTQIYADKIESVVRRFPGQWMWIHRRWKEFRD